MFSNTLLSRNYYKIEEAQSSYSSDITILRTVGSNSSCLKDTPLCVLVAVKELRGIKVNGYIWCLKKSPPQKKHCLLHVHTKLM